LKGTAAVTPAAATGCAISGSGSPEPAVQVIHGTGNDQPDHYFFKHGFLLFRFCSRITDSALITNQGPPAMLRSDRLAAAIFIKNIPQLPG